MRILITAEIAVESSSSNESCRPEPLMGSPDRMLFSWSLWIVATLLALLVAVDAQAAESFTGKAVGVTDGDTISVLRDGKAVKIRLDGIDCPERGDDFSSKAKKFTSALVFGKSVEVRGKDNDRYGRLVARIVVDGQDVSVALVQAGLAWHYLKYSSDPVLRRAETTAKAAEIGVWSLPNPLPPWEVRSLRKSGASPKQAVATSKDAPPSGDSGVVFHGNRRSRVFHAPWCRYYTCKNCVVEFTSKQEAIEAGYRPGGHCRP